MNYQEINGESHLAKLIIVESHNAVLHNGIAQTVCHIRKKYWIPRARQLVKGFIRRCYICRKHQGKTYEAPPIPSLPDFRVSESPPFYNTGLDFIGPLFTTKGSKVSKNYILLLTCCSTRAVYLEVWDNLTVQSLFPCLSGDLRPGGDYQGYLLVIMLSNVELQVTRFLIGSL